MSDPKAIAEFIVKGRQAEMFPYFSLPQVEPLARAYLDLLEELEDHKLNAKEESTYYEPE